MNDFKTEYLQNKEKLLREAQESFEKELLAIFQTYKDLDRVMWRLHIDEDYFDMNRIETTIHIQQENRLVTYALLSEKEKDPYRALAKRVEAFFEDCPIEMITDLYGQNMKMFAETDCSRTRLCVENDVC